jgi:hypothetical protein
MEQCDSRNTLTYMNVLKLEVEAPVNECSLLRMALSSAAEIGPEETSRRDRVVMRGRYPHYCSSRHRAESLLTIPSRSALGGNGLTTISA